MKLLSVCLAFALLLGAAPAIAAGDEPLTINVILSLTGPAAFVGVDEKAAFAVYETRSIKPAAFAAV